MTTSNRLANPIDLFEMHSFRLFAQICKQYGCCYSDEWHTQMRKVLDALIECFDHDADVSAALRALYDWALDDFKIGRGQAEIENWLRDEQLSQRRQATREKEGV